MTQMNVSELAGLQDDPLIEEVIAILFSDQPVRSVIRPDDSRRHWQWWADTPQGSTSRLWLSYAEIITDDTVPEMEDRVRTALAVLVPTYVTTIEVTAVQTHLDEIALDIVLGRPRQTDLTVGFLLTQQGGTDA
jgi:phage gp46-like protein